MLSDIKFVFAYYATIYKYSHNWRAFDQVNELFINFVKN